MTGKPFRAQSHRMQPAGQTVAHGFFVLGFLWATAVSGQASADITVPQANGDSLTLPVPARKIVTLAPNLAELVFAAGAGQYLQAVVEHSDYPPRVALLPRVGDAFRVDLEQIVGIKPDLVIAWTSGNPQTALLKLQQLGFSVWQMEITRPEEIADAVENIGRAAGTDAQGERAADIIRKRLLDLRRDYAGKSQLGYFYQISPRPLYTINGDHIISRSLEVCGGQNVFARLSSLAPQISFEAVIMADPQVMIAPRIPGEAPALEHWKEWPGLRAVKNDSLLYLPADDISRAAPRLLDSIELACKLLEELRKR